MLVRHHRGLSVKADPYYGEGGRGIIAGGGSPWVDKIEYITVSTPSNGTDFGVLSSGAGWNFAGTSGNGRGFICAGNNGADPWVTNEIRYVTIGTLGNSADWGDLPNVHGKSQATTNGDRALTMGGEDGDPNWDEHDRIEYFSTVTAGNGSNFGTISSGIVAQSDATSDGTYAIVGHGRRANNTHINWVDYCVIDTLGNTTQFGTGIEGKGMGACSNGTRAFYFAGDLDSAPFSYTTGKTIEYWTFATPSNASRYGDLSDTFNAAKGLSDGSRGVAVCVYDGQLANMEYFDLNSSAVTSTNFGDLYNPSGGNPTSGRSQAAVLAGD